MNADDEEQFGEDILRQLPGYYALTIKPFTVSGEPFSNTVRRKLSRVSTLNEEEHTYSLAACLIAQLGKNYADGANERVTDHTSFAAGRLPGTPDRLNGRTLR